MAISAQHRQFVTNEYVSPIPAEDLIKVAIKKQEMYDEGRKQIKQVYDNYGKLRATIKNENELKYYDQEMQKIHKNVQQNAGLDFSNIGNVEAVINLAKPFENDEYIKTALENGQEIERRQKELASMSKDKRSADNDLVFMYDAQKHMESGGLGEKITKNKTYQDYIDIRAKIMEIEKSIPAEEFTDPTLYQGPDGYLKQVEYKRKRREDIYQRAMNGLTPAEKAQLQIHAQANMLRLGNDVVYQNWVGYNKEEKLLADQKRKEATQNLAELRAVKNPTAQQLSDMKRLDNAVKLFESTISAANENINMSPDQFIMDEYVPFFMKRQIDGIAGQLAFSNTKTELKEDKTYMAQLEHNLNLQRISAQGRETRYNELYKNDLENFQTNASVGLNTLKNIGAALGNTKIDATKSQVEQITDMITAISNNTKLSAGLKNQYITELKQLQGIYETAKTAKAQDKVVFNRSSGLGQVQTSISDFLNRPVLDIVRSGNTLEVLTFFPKSKTAGQKAQDKLELYTEEAKVATPGITDAEAVQKAQERMKNEGKKNEIGFEIDPRTGKPKLNNTSDTTTAG